MATYCQNKRISWFVNHICQTAHNDFRLCVTPSGSSVSVDLTSSSYCTGTNKSGDKKIYWDMLLQRYNSSTKAWNTIGSRTGYVSKSSPSHRTFTNIKKQNAALRIWVRIKEVDGSYKGYLTSTAWTY